jgi:hypothetical protein
MSGTKIRYVAKKLDRAWYVYDTEMASYPGYRAGTIVKQGLDNQADAEAEAERLEELET